MISLQHCFHVYLFFQYSVLISFWSNLLGPSLVENIALFRGIVGQLCAAMETGCPSVDCSGVISYHCGCGYFWVSFFPLPTPPGYLRLLPQSSPSTSYVSILYQNKNTSKKSVIRNVETRTKNISSRSKRNSADITELHLLKPTLNLACNVQLYLKQNS